MVFDVCTPEGWVTLDTTRRYNTIGRLMNHAPVRKATVKPFKALHVGDKWKVAFLAVRDIEEGEELTWDYQLLTDLRTTTTPIFLGTFLVHDLCVVQ